MMKNIQKKPKMVVLISKGGNGHIAASAVLKTVFPDFEIVEFNPIHDFFHKLFDGEGLYDWLLQNSWIKFNNFFAGVLGKTFFIITKKIFKKRFLKLLNKEKPDLFISLIPFVNYSAYGAAQELNIPFLLITLDADLTLWLVDMQRCIKHDFTITTQMKTLRMEKQLARAKIPSSCVREVGCPLRKDFFAPKDQRAIKKEWNIPEDKQVVMLIRGSTGSNKLLDQAKELIKLDKPIHILVCVGRNKKLASKLESLKTDPSTHTFSIIPFTPKIPDLMCVADLLIAQPSPTVCNEAMHMNLPILIDMTSPCLFWESATVDWIKSRGGGQILRHKSQLNEQVVACLEKSKNGALKPKPVLDFNTSIRTIVTQDLLNLWQNSSLPEQIESRVDH